MDIQAWLGLAIHAGQTPGALPAAFRDVPPTTVLGYTAIATALLLGLVGLVGLLQRRWRGTKNDS